MEKLENYSKNGVPVYMGCSADVNNMSRKEDSILITSHPDAKRVDTCLLYGFVRGKVVGQRLAPRHRTEVDQMRVIRDRQILKAVQELNEIIREKR